MIKKEPVPHDPQPIGPNTEIVSNLETPLSTSDNSTESSSTVLPTRTNKNGILWPSVESNPPRINQRMLVKVKMITPPALP